MDKLIFISKKKRISETEALDILIHYRLSNEVNVHINDRNELVANSPEWTKKIKIK